LIRTGCEGGDAVGILSDQIAIEEIWTYDRAPGRRILFPWSVPDLPRGTVQMDLVFNEALPSPTISLPIADDDGCACTLECASAEQSLAWKVLWLHTDRFPQGKDLYDAVLLAEYVRLAPALLHETLASSPDAMRCPFTAESPRRWHVDWKNFQLEYPTVQGDVQSWISRLIAALFPTE